MRKILQKLTKVINFIKKHFLIITGVILSLCLIGVGIYGKIEDEKQPSYKVDLQVINKDSSRVVEIETHGFPHLNKTKKGYELTDYSFVLFEAKDSCKILKIKKL